MHTEARPSPARQPSARLPRPPLAPVDPAFLKSLREHVHDTLRKAIIAGRFAPEQRLNERSLAQELGVSTTPLKEALRRLESEGLVRIEARRGVYVTFSAAQAEEMALARAALESMIARLAARRATTVHHADLSQTVQAMAAATADGDVERLIDLNGRFHGVIHVASGCTYLQRLLDGQRMYDHATRVALLSDADERRLALDEHRRILDALLLQDADRAERAMRDHIVRSGQQHVDSVFAVQIKDHA
jgi:DNA-binding GntR family transcriptional regulator